MLLGIEVLSPPKPLLPGSASGGKIDFSARQHGLGHVWGLDGEWLFYPGILRDDLSAMPGSRVAAVPHFWEEDPELGRSPFGFGTYSLTITGLSPRGVYALNLPDQVSAYRLAANGSVIALNGQTGSSAASSRPCWQPQVVGLSADDAGVVRLAMQISNFSYYRGGFWNMLEFGPLELVVARDGWFKYQEVFLMGLIITAAVINLGLFSIHPENKSLVLFSAFCALVVAKTALEGHRIVLDFFPGIDWEWIVRLDFLVGYLLLPVFALFALELYPIGRPTRPIEAGFAACGALVVAGCLVLPHGVYAAAIEAYKVVALAISVAFIALASTAMARKKPGAGIVLYSVFWLAASIFQELVVRGPVSLVPFATAQFVLCFTMMSMGQVYLAVKKSEVLEKKIVRDPLTGLLNRAYLATLSREAMGGAGPLWVLFLDLDRFKSVNDGGGHRVGDRVLRDVAERLSLQVRSTDVVCRYGGDEFVVVTRGGEEGDVRSLADRISAAVSEPFSVEGRDYAIGVSIGIAGDDTGTVPLETLVRRSDEAMYRIKRER